MGQVRKGSKAIARRSASSALGTVPALIQSAGPKATRRYFEFFTANIRNRNTREAYFRALNDFFSWLDDRNVKLIDIEPVIVAAYVEYLGTIYSKPSVKQHLAAIRMCMDWLVLGQIIPMNPASSVRGPKYVTKCGKTPVLTSSEARQLLDSIDISTLVGLRDRALIATMLFTFARVSAVTGMRIDDYYRVAKRTWIRLQEKGGKHHEVPAHHLAEQYLDEYLKAAGHSGDKLAPLFLTAKGRTGKLTDSSLSRHDALRAIKRRAKAAGLSRRLCCHTFRATGITAYLENGGTIEGAQTIAAHESPRTTKLYDRTDDTINLDEIERIKV